MTAVLQWRGLHAWYGDQAVLLDVDITLPRLGCCVLLGPCGTGKSTLLKSLHALAHNGLLHASNGLWRTLADSTPGCDALPCELVEQKPVRPTGTVGQYLADGAELPEANWLSTAPNSLGQQLTNEVLAWIPQAVSALTPGEWALLRIVRASLRAPALLLLDEPTAGLDESAAVAVRALIQRFSGTHSMVLVTHHLKEAQLLAQHVVLMANGRVVEAATAAQFFHAPKTDAARHFLQFGSLPESARAAPTAAANTSAELQALWAQAFAAMHAQRIPIQAPLPPALAACLHWLLPGRLAGLSQAWPLTQQDACQSLQAAGIDTLLLLSDAPSKPLIANAPGIRILTCPVDTLNGMAEQPQQSIATMAQGLDCCLLLDAQLQQGSRILVVSDAAPSTVSTALAMYWIWRGRGQCGVHSAQAVMQRLATNWQSTVAQQRYLARFFEFIVQDVAFTD